MQRDVEVPGEAEMLAMKAGWPPGSSIRNQRPEGETLRRAFEHVAADALRAAQEALAKQGLEDAGIVVNVAWRDPTGKNEFAVGTVAPSSYPMLADSLKQSAEEVADSNIHEEAGR